MRANAIAALVRILPPGWVALLRLFVRPGSGWAIAVDLWQTRRAAGFLRRGIAAAPPGAPRVVALLLTDSVYEIKLQLMLLVALRLAGWETLVLTHRSGWSVARAYSRVFGIEHAVHFDEFAADASARERIASAAAKFLAGSLEFRDVKRWEWDGCWIGPQLLATLSRARHQAAPDPRAPEIRAELAELLPIALSSADQAAALVERVRPALGITVEANYAVNGVVVDRLIGAGASVIQVTQPWRDDALMCRRLVRATRREHPSSLSRESLQRLMAEPWTAREERELQAEFEDRYEGRWFLQKRNQTGTRVVERSELAARLGLRPGRKLAVIFSHVLWDANLFYGDDIFDDYGDWFVQTIVGAAGNEMVDWLVKLHPANVWKRAYQGYDGEYTEHVLIRERIGELPSHVRLIPADTEVSSLSLYRAADCGVTVRGTPGMEMPCFGKPVLTAGTGRYSGLGFTMDFATAGEYLACLATIQDVAPLDEQQTMLAKRHAHTVFRRRQWRMQSFQSSFDYRPRGSHPLDHNLGFLVNSLAEIERNGDLAHWAAWAADFDEVDYLDE